MKYDSQIDKNRVFLMLLIFAGVGVRLLQFFYNRSIWYDEAKVTLHILVRSFSELHWPMPTATSAPLFFLYLVKFNTVIFGYNEYALRLLPLFCGILTVILYYFFSRAILPQPYNIISVAFIAFASPLIYYSVECKQYGIDVFVTLCLFLSYIYLINQNHIILKNILLVGILGIIAILFSYPSVFVLAAIGCTLIYHWRYKLKLTDCLILFFIGVIWILAFYIQYVITLDHIQKVDWFHNFWLEGYVQPYFSLNALKHNVDLTRNLLIFAGLPNTAMILIPCVILIILGFFDIWDRHRPLALLIICLTCFLVLASLSMKYPIAKRMALFTLPIIFILISAGSFRLSTYWNKVGLYILITILLTFLTINLFKLWPPIEKENFKLAMAQIRSQAMPKDGLYMNQRAIPSFLCHHAIQPYKYPNSIWGKMPFRGLDKDALDQLAKSEITKMMNYQRVWLLFNNTNSRNWILNHMPGKPLSHYSYEGINLYLYEMPE